MDDRKPTPQPAAQQAHAPAPSRNTVTVGCKLPNGLKIRLYAFGKDAMGNVVAQPASGWVTLNGANTSGVIGGFGLTEVDESFWSEWRDKNKDAPYVKNGLVFAESNRDRGIARALDYEKAPTGLEPIDPEKPRVRGVKPVPKEELDAARRMEGAHS